MTHHQLSVGRKIKLGFGVFLVIIGLPLYFLPIPLGIVTLFPGIALIMHSSETSRRYVRSLRTKAPGLWRRLRPLIKRACDDCDPKPGQ